MSAKKRAKKAKAKIKGTAKSAKASTPAKKAKKAKPVAKAAAARKGAKPVAKKSAKKAVAKSPAKKAAAKGKTAAKSKSPAKKLAKTAAAKSPPKKPAKKPPMKRRDGAGHLDPQYAADLRALEPPKDDDRAFLDGMRSTDSGTEELGEEYVAAATSGEDAAEDIRNEHVTEEIGGPFVQSSAGTEYAHGTDESNPDTATREPFPKT